MSIVFGVGDRLAREVRGLLDDIGVMGERAGGGAGLDLLRCPAGGAWGGLRLTGPGGVTMVSLLVTAVSLWSLSTPPSTGSVSGMLDRVSECSPSLNSSF